MRRLALGAYAESVYAARFTAGPLASLRDDRYKLIFAPEPELYVLLLDPFEDRNVRGSKPPSPRR